MAWDGGVWSVPFRLLAANFVDELLRLLAGAGSDDARHHWKAHGRLQMKRRRDAACEQRAPDKCERERDSNVCALLLTSLRVYMLIRSSERRCTRNMYMEERQRQAMHAIGAAKRSHTAEFLTSGSFHELQQLSNLSRCLVDLASWHHLAECILHFDNVRQDDG